MLWRPYGYLFALFAAFLVGCAQVPKESIELSNTLGQDLEVAHRSHRKAVDLLYDRSIESVNRFLMDVAMPEYVDAGFEAIRKDLEQDAKVAFAPGSPKEAKNKLVTHIQQIIQSASAQVARDRKELTVPIEEARKASLEELDLAYGQMQKANNVLTVHLESVMKVHTLQDDILAKGGLQGFREKVGAEALAANAKITSAIVKTDNAKDGLAKLKEAVKELQK